MMQKLSVVIVCKNGVKVIGETIASFSGLTDDIVIYDNGSTDGTQEIVKGTNAKLIEGGWEGFGKTKNKANAFAKYDWILSLDADEAIDEELKANLLESDLIDDKTVYEFKFKNFLGDKWLRYGEWGDDKHIRLFNRKQVHWNDATVHETLIFPEEVRIIQLKGYVLHRTAATIEEYEEKMRSYAGLNAEKYFKQNKNSGTVQMTFSPTFSFIKNYFFKLGFLDGAEGYQCAKINAHYTFLKYKQLKKIKQQSVSRSQ
jgi:glycosyltransferase involved in cell wall biosynthesis